MSADIIQGSPEWFAARLGKATASKIADIIAKTKSGPAASRATYQGQLVAERLSQQAAESFSNAAMQWGTDQEPNARAAYAFLHASGPVVEVGFVDHPTVAMSGASPDGLVGDDGLVEIKCPNTATHIATLKGRAVPGKYLTQIQWQLACTRRKWCDFVSYDPRLPDELQLYVERVHRDDDMIRELEAEVAAFLADVDADVAALEAIRQERLAA